MTKKPTRFPVFSRIRKLANSAHIDDLLLAKEYLMEHFFELTYKQFEILNAKLWRSEFVKHVDYSLSLEVSDIQKHWHDKWKKTRKTNKRSNIIENK